MKIKALIFDLDDTLYREIDFIRSGFHEVAKYLSKKYDFSQDFIYKELLSGFKKGIRKNNFNILLETINGNQGELHNLIEIYRYHKPRILLCKDSSEILYCSKNYYKLGLITDGHIKTQENKIDALGIKSFFNSIIINDITKGIDKSIKDPFIQLINSLDICSGNAIFIGDNPLKDFIVPKKLGIFSIRIKRIEGIYTNIPTRDEVDFEISDLTELKHIIPLIEGEE